MNDELEDERQNGPKLEALKKQLIRHHENLYKFPENAEFVAKVLISRIEGKPLDPPVYYEIYRHGDDVLIVPHNKEFSHKLNASRVAGGVGDYMEKHYNRGQFSYNGYVIRLENMPHEGLRAATNALNYVNQREKNNEVPATEISNAALNSGEWSLEKLIDAVASKALNGEEPETSSLADFMKKYMAAKGVSGLAPIRSDEARRIKAGVNDAFNGDEGEMLRSYGIDLIQCKSAMDSLIDDLLAIDLHGRPVNSRGQLDKR